MRSPFVLLAFAPLFAAGCDGSLAGQPCGETGATVCEETALLRCNGNFYDVVADCHFECVDGDGTTHDTQTLASDESWTCAEGPHIVPLTLTVGAGATLTLEAGAQVRIDPGARINTDAAGRIDSQGLTDVPVLVTSNNEQSPGYGSQAEGGLNVFATTGTEPSSIRFTILERGIHGLGVFGIAAGAALPVVENNTFRDNSRFGVIVSCSGGATAPDFAADGNQFFRNDEADVGGCE